jgi:phosphonate transport system ATP-binding protein
VTAVARGSTPVVARGLRLAFGEHTVLDGLDLTIPPGQAVALIGASGAGKTTLLRVLSTMLRPDHGQLQVLGEDPATLSSRALRALRRRVGLLYQNDALIPGLRTVHNVLMGRLGHWSTLKSLWSLVWPLEVDRARAALEAMGIADKLDAPVGTLSGGQRQRVALARLLVQDPELVLADEPAASLDPRLARTTLEILLRLVRDRGRTLVVSLHAMDLLGLGFDRVLALRDGRWFWDGHPDAWTPALAVDLFAGREVAEA